MIRKRPILLTFVVVTVLLAGCARYPSGPEVHVGFYGSVSATDSGFVMDGYLQAGGGIADQDRYEAVTLLLTSEDGEELYTENLGDLAVDGRKNVSVRLNRSVRPYYVVFTSQDFWQEDLTVDYFQWSGDRYRRREAATRDELPTQ